MGFGPLWRGVRLHTKLAFMVIRLTIGASNDLQMARNLIGGLPVLYQGRLANLGPFRECLTPAHEKRQKGYAGAHRSVGLQNGQRGKCSDAWDEHVCKCDAHDDMIWNAWHEQNAKWRQNPTTREYHNLELKMARVGIQLWQFTYGVLQHSTTTKGSRPAI